MCMCVYTFTTAAFRTVSNSCLRFACRFVAKILINADATAKTAADARDVFLDSTTRCDDALFVKGPCASTPVILLRRLCYTLH